LDAAQRHAYSRTSGVKQHSRRAVLSNHLWDYPCSSGLRTWKRDGGGGYFLAIGVIVDWFVRVFPRSRRRPTAHRGHRTTIMQSRDGPFRTGASFFFSTRRRVGGDLRNAPSPGLRVLGNGDIYGLSTPEIRRGPLVVLPGFEKVRPHFSRTGKGWALLLDTPPPRNGVVRGLRPPLYEYRWAAPAGRCICRPPAGNPAALRAHMPPPELSSAQSRPTCLGACLRSQGPGPNSRFGEQNRKRSPCSRLATYAFTLRCAVVCCGTPDEQRASC